MGTLDNGLKRERLRLTTENAALADMLGTAIGLSSEARSGSIGGSSEDMNWDRQRAELLRAYERSAPQKLCVSPDGCHCITAAADRDCKWWR